MPRVKIPFIIWVIIIAFMIEQSEERNKPPVLKPVGTPVPRIKPKPPPKPPLYPQPTIMPPRTPTIESNEPAETEQNDDVGFAVSKTKTISKESFIKLPAEETDDEEMVEIDITDNETQNEEELAPVPKQTITRKIKKKFKEATNENSLLGHLLENGTFMTAMKAGAGGFSTLASLCLFFLILKFIKTM